MADLQSEVWLIKSRMNPFPVKGEMALSGGRVTVVITGGADCTGNMREYLQEQSGIGGLADRLKAAEAVEILAFAPSEASVSFPAMSGGYIGVFEVGGKTWNIALAYPAGGAITNVLSMRKGRKLARDWKDALS